MSVSTAWDLTKATFSDWSEDNATRLAAALAYYAIFSLAPLLIIAIAVAGFVWSEQAATEQVQQRIRDYVGPQAAPAVTTMIQNAGQRGSGIIATVLGVGFLILGATAVFAELQSSLNTIWEVQAKAEGVWGVVRRRFLSFLMVLFIGLLLLSLLVASAVVNAAMGLIGMPILTRVVDWIVSIGIATALFAFVFKVLPDVKIRWQAVWIGALVTAVLFTLGKFLIGLYLGRSSVSSVFGAAGSLVALLVWVYYSAQIVFLGAEFTQVYARWSGERIEPSENAEPLSPAPAAAPLAQQPQRAAAPSRVEEQTPAERYPAVPARRELAFAPAHRPPQKTGRLVPFLAGAALGGILLRGKKQPNSTRRRRHLAASKILQPGWASR